MKTEPTVQLNATVSESTRRTLKALSTMQGRTMADTLESAVRLAMDVYLSKGGSSRLALVEFDWYGSSDESPLIDGPEFVPLQPGDTEAKPVKLTVLKTIEIP